MIGVFDSGLGGLTVLKELRAVLPEFDYLYLGDTLHVPYGNRSDEAVFELTKKACDFLFDKGCKLIIIACNTATAKSLRKLQQEYLPSKRQEMKNDLLNILGVVRPVVEHFAQQGGDKIGVIATRGTIGSGIYKNELQEHGYTGQVVQLAAPLLVPLIEENWLKKSVTRKILRMYLNVLKLKNISSLVLGCTHYPILLPQIRNIMGKKYYIPNSAQIVAESLKEYLSRHQDLRDSLSQNQQVNYFVTDLNENFQSVAHIFIKEELKIKKVIL